MVLGDTFNGCLVIAKVKLHDVAIVFQVMSFVMTLAAIFTSLIDGKK